MDYLLLSVFTLVPALAVFASTALSIGRTPQLATLPDTLPENAPRLSIVFSALNEADTIEPALRSLLALDYPGLEIIAIDDRSTDATGAILDRVAKEDTRVRVLHIERLPEGWLGKNHALHVGAAMAAGEYILFTDADVHFEKRALRQAIAYCEREELDHLCVLGEFIARDSFLAALLTDAFGFLHLRHPLWLVRKWRRAYIGGGLFNLVRATSYRRAGGHAPLKMEVLDDLMLGKLMKVRGFRQAGLLGAGSVRVEWYRSVGEFVRGLEKNGFAAVNYNFARLSLMTVAMVIGRYWPVEGVFITRGAVWWINAAAVAAMLATSILVARSMRWSWHSLWWWPISPLASAFVLWRSALFTARRGGIIWRGTLYPLRELKAARSNELPEHEPAQRASA